MRRSASISIFLTSVLAVACGGGNANREAPPVADGSSATADTHEVDNDVPEGQLPGYVAPTAYDIHLTVDPDRDGFSGKVEVQIKLDEARDHIWMHGRDLRVAVATAKLADGRVIPVRYRELSANGLARIGFPEVVQPQELTLSFSYEAKYSDGLEGLYVATADGKRYVFAQFEPLSARLCFPSFDEPRFKTPYAIALTTKAEHVALSASPIASEDAAAPLKTTRFKRTEKLPTYLITFAVGDFDVVDAGTIPASASRKETIPLRGIATKGKGPLLQEALESTKQLVLALETYFGIGYPFGKLDIIAVPDFGYGAMENVGAITFRDYLVLWDPATVTVTQRRYGNTVIAHELAHQWFGNIVTPAWWDDAWLNESFASWISYRIVQSWNPGLGAGLDRVYETHGAIEEDWLPSARSVRNRVLSEDDVFSAFDSITYEKGMGVLSMFENYLGAEPFRKAVQLHMEKFRFGTATANDFFTSVAESTGKDVVPAMRGFIEQAGLPLLDTTVRCNAGAPARVTLKQQRYLPIGVQADTERLWQIPVCVRYESGMASPRQECWLLDKPETNVTLAGRGCPSWLMPNARASGYYRFGLDNAEIDALVLAAQTRKLDASEVLTLANNVWGGLQSGTVSASAALRFANALSVSSDWHVAAIAMHIVKVLRDDVVDVGMMANAEAFGRELYKRRAPTVFVTPPKESDDAHLVRAKIAWFLVEVARDPVVRNEAAKRGDAALQALEQGQPVAKVVDIDMLGTAVSAALDVGGAATHDRIANILATVTDPAVRHELIAGLGMSRDPGLAEKSFALTLDPRLRTNEMTSLMYPLSQHRETRKLTWAWLQANFDAFLARSAIASRSAIPRLAETLCLPEAKEQVEAFFKPRLDKLEGGPHALSIATETIAACAGMANAQRESAHKFLGTVKPHPVAAQ